MVWEDENQHRKGLQKWKESSLLRGVGGAVENSS